MRIAGRSAWVLLIAAPVLLLAASAAWPLRTDSGFDAAGTLASKGRILRVAGPITCTKDVALRIDVTVTQRKTGALGRGTWRAVCTGTPQRWKIEDVRAVGARRFATGRVRACAAAVLRNNRGPIDAMQWCEDVRLRQA